MRGSSISSPKFPLPEDAFAAARLSAAQLQQYRQQIDALAARALDECDRADALGRAAYSAPWEVVGAQESVTALRRKDHATSSSFRLIGDVSGDYRDIMELYYAASSHELYESLQFMYHYTLDAQVLQTLETASPERPHRYVGVKWAVFQLSVFSTKVFQCFLESMTYRKDRRGREVGVRVTLPLRLPEIDHTMDALKVRRMSSQMVQIVRPSGPSATRVFVQIENDFALAAPAAYTKTLLTTSQNLATCVDARRIRRRGLVPETDWVANSARKSCVVCTKTFGATRGRHHCRLCGDIVCRKCMLVRDTAEPLSQKTFKVAKTKFCVVCIANLRKPEGAEDLSASRVVASGKVRELAFAPADFDEGSRVSVWSETESEGCHADFDFTDSARSSQSSYSEGQDGEKHSFGKRLEEIAERIEDAVIEEGAATKPKPAEMVLFVPDETTDTAEFMVTIDTKDMAREPHAHLFDSEPTPLSSSGVFERDFTTTTPERRRSSNPLSSSRSIDQCLAEQEALLRQMVMATQGVPTPRHHDSPSHHFEYDA